MKLLLFSLLFPTAAMAATEMSLKTPRGTVVPVIVHRMPLTNPRAVLVMAPGQSCNYLNPLFEALGNNGVDSGITVIRFEWSYCSNEKKEDREPSADLANEIEDMKTVISFAQNLNFGDLQRLVIGGKSLGSIVAYKLFSADKNIKALAMLTPVCSYTKDANDSPLPSPIPLGEENYPKIDQESRPMLMALGDRDPLCLTPLLYDFVRTAQIGRVSVIVGVGDHGFRTYSSMNNVDEFQTSENIRSIMPPIMNWILYNIRK